MCTNWVGVLLSEYHIFLFRGNIILILFYSIKATNHKNLARTISVNNINLFHQFVI